MSFLMRFFVLVVVMKVFMGFFFLNMNRGFNNLFFLSYDRLVVMMNMLDDSVNVFVFLDMYRDMDDNFFLFIMFTVK